MVRVHGLSTELPINCISSICRGAKAMPYIQVWSSLAISSCQLQPNKRRCETIQTILAPYGHSFFEFGVVHKAIPTDAALCIYASHRWLESSRSESYWQLPQQSSSSILVLFDKPQCPRGGKPTAIVPSQAWSVISLYSVQRAKLPECNAQWNTTGKFTIHCCLQVNDHVYIYWTPSFA